MYGKEISFKLHIRVLEYLVGAEESEKKFKSSLHIYSMAMSSSSAVFLKNLQYTSA